MSSYNTSNSSSSSTSSSNWDLTDELNNVKIQDDKEINILLLGETGVGKSTFINSFANYLSIKYFNDAENKGLVKLIPTRYTIKDKNKKDHIIKIGPKRDENEHLKTGESATQKVKTYVFPVWKGHGKVRLIDTPGMGDTRGIEQDEENCENIINYLKKLDKIHAICFLCKPTNPRKTIYFDYCIYQILSHLEKEALKNIYFLFTNTRGSNYGPGDTLPVLNAIVESIETTSGVKIPLGKNIYCFDNEGFKFLGACEKNIQFDDSTRDKYVKSWVFSAKQCWIFIKHLHNDVEPYVPNKILEVNFAKKMLFQFSKILAKITMLKTDSQNVLDRMEENRNRERISISELKNQKTKVTDVVEKQMSQPMLVCTSVPTCAEVYKVKGRDKWHYKKICHCCYELSNVQLSITGAPDIVNCHSINKNNRKCTQCGCDFLLHMHIDYITSLEENLMVDDDIGHLLATRESLLDKYKDTAEDVQTQIVQYQSEYDEIKTCCINLSRYLHQHAIVVFSDSYKEYIDYLISQNQYAGASNSSASIDELKKFKDAYLEAEQAIKDSLKPTSVKNLVFNMDDEHFQNLFKLKQFGTKIHDIYFYQKLRNSIDYEVAEYVHDKYYVKDHDRNRNRRSNDGNRRGGRGRGGQNRRTRQDDNSSKYPERPDSRSSTASYQSGRSNKRGQGYPPRRPERPDSRSSTSSHQPNRSDRDEGNYQQYGQDYRSGYPPNFGNYPSQPYSPNYPDASNRGRDCYNVTVTVDNDPRSPNYGAHPPPPNEQYAPPHGPYPPTYGQHPPPYGQHPPPYGQHAPPYGQHAPPYGQPPPYGQHPPPYGQHPPPYRRPPPAGEYPRGPHSAGYPKDERPRDSERSGRGRFNKNNQGDGDGNRNKSRDKKSDGKKNNAGDRKGDDKRDDRGRSATRGGKGFEWIESSDEKSDSRRGDRRVFKNKNTGSVHNLFQPQMTREFTRTRSSSRNVSAGRNEKRRDRKYSGRPRNGPPRDSDDSDERTGNGHFNKNTQGDGNRNNTRDKRSDGNRNNAGDGKSDNPDRRDDAINRGRNVTKGDGKSDNPSDRRDDAMNRERNITKGDGKSDNPDRRDDAINRGRNVTKGDGKSDNPSDRRDDAMNKERNVTKGDGKSDNPSDRRDDAMNRERNATKGDGKSDNPSDRRDDAMNRERNVTKGDGKSDNPSDRRDDAMNRGRNVTEGAKGFESSAERPAGGSNHRAFINRNAGSKQNIFIPQETKKEEASRIRSDAQTENGDLTMTECDSKR